MKVRVALLEEELHESQMLGEEADQLRLELEEAKAEATSAKHAADRLNHIFSEHMGQSLSNIQFSMDEMDEKKVEFDHLTKSEAWITLVSQIFGTFKEHMRQLGDFYDLVIRIVESKDILLMLPPQVKSKRRGSIWGSHVDKRQDELDRRKEELDLRQKLLAEHVQFFNERFLEMEDGITNRADSLDEILESVRKEREEIESKLSTGAFMQNLFLSGGKSEDLIHLLSALLVERDSTNTAEEIELREDDPSTSSDDFNDRIHCSTTSPERVWSSPKIYTNDGSCTEAAELSRADDSTPDWRDKLTAFWNNNRRAMQAEAKLTELKLNASGTFEEKMVESGPLKKDERDDQMSTPSKQISQSNETNLSESSIEDEKCETATDTITDEDGE